MLKKIGIFHALGSMQHERGHHSKSSKTERTEPKHSFLHFCKFI